MLRAWRKHGVAQMLSKTTKLFESQKNDRDLGRLFQAVFPSFNEVERSFAARGLSP